ncbi:MAG: hypothetical protein LBU73_00370 [Helicobacteraceae bacterium]|jgi:hypothetical protein|nr:hypothetical protein [Helicobacteraceae bacterium]
MPVILPNKEIKEKESFFIICRKAIAFWFKKKNLYENIAVIVYTLVIFSFGFSYLPLNDYGFIGIAIFIAVCLIPLIDYSITCVQEESKNR